MSTAGSWWQSAASTLTSFSESLVGDLKEFAGALTEENEHLLASASASAPAPAPASGSASPTATEQAAAPATQPADHHATDTATVELDSDSLVFPRNRLAHLKEVQLRESTYLEDPEDDDDQGDAFCAFQIRFELEYSTSKWQAKLQRVLSTQRAVQDMHARLVPVEVEEWRFWCRYVYRLQQLDQEHEQRLAELEEKMKNQLSGGDGGTDDIDDDDDAPLEWVDDDVDDDGDGPDAPQEAVVVAGGESAESVVEEDWIVHDEDVEDLVGTDGPFIENDWETEL